MGPVVGWLWGRGAEAGHGGWWGEAVGPGGAWGQAVTVAGSGSRALQCPGPGWGLGLHCKGVPASAGEPCGAGAQGECPRAGARLRVQCPLAAGGDGEALESSVAAELEGHTFFSPSSNYPAISSAHEVLHTRKINRCC